MSEWRRMAPLVEWAYEKEVRPSGECEYILYALVPGGRERMGCIAMDCGGEGWGRSVAEEIVSWHNDRVRCKPVDRALIERAAKVFETVPSYVPEGAKPAPPFLPKGKW